MTDIFDRIEKHTGGPLGQYAAKAFGYYMFPKLEGELGPHMKFQGKDVLVWSLNNYLGLANHPEVRKADAEAAAKWGLAYPMGSRLMTGHTDLHEELERRLSSRGTDSAEVVKKRIDEARAEIARKDEYDYTIVNGVLENAVNELYNIIVNLK